MRVRYILAALAPALLLGGCQSDRPETRTEPPAQAAIDPAQVALAAAETITARFQRDLKSELFAAMNAGGAGHAVLVCNTRAKEIAEVNAHSGAWTVTRVTDRPRIPAHMADDHQLAILHRFADSSYREIHAAEWLVGTAGDSTYVYYEAIRLGEFCTNCHGNLDKLAQGVPERLAELYPKDKALGYEVGDLRGMFVVTMNWPEALAPAQALLAPPDSTATDSL